MGSSRKGKSLASKGTSHKCITPPAVSNIPPTPPPKPDGVPAPFPYMAQSSSGDGTASKVKIAGGEALIDGSKMDVMKPGNQPATTPMKELVTHQINAKVVVSASGNVTANSGKAIAELSNRCTPNVTGGSGPAGTTGTLIAPPGVGASGAGAVGGSAQASPTNDTTKGDPVSVVSGQVVRDAVDLVLPGPIPVAWRRRYSSAFHKDTTTLGRGGWTHELHQWLFWENEKLVLRGDDGFNLALPSVGENETFFHRGRRLVVTRLEGDRYTIESLDTLVTHSFAPLAKGGLPVLREMRDRWGNRVELDYDQGRLTRVRAAGRELRVTYSASGRAMRVEAWAAGAAHQAVAYTYTKDGELASVTDALGHVERYAYDGVHRMAGVTFKNGVSFYYRYDNDSGRCVHTWGDGGLHDVEFTYDLNERTTVAADCEARRYTWNDRGALVKEETPDSSFAKEFVYDEDLLVVAEKNAAGETVESTYDARGNCTQQTDPAGNVTRWEYDENGFPSKKMGPDGLVTEYVFDRRGAMTELRLPTGLHYRMTYEGTGKLAAIFGAEGTLASFEYDEHYNLVRETDARQAVTQYAYDALGRLTSMTDALGQISRVEYDALGRPAIVHQPDGTRRQLAYDALGNVARHVDPMGRATKMEYAGTGVLARTTGPNGQSWEFEYDANERLREVKNPKQEIYGFSYDRAGRVIEERTFDGRALRYGYSTADRLKRVELPDGTWREFGYDLLGNLVLDASPHGSQKFERDTLGRVLEATVVEHNGKTVVKFERDAFGRIVAESQNGQTIRYVLDERGQRRERVLPDGERTEYAFDVTGAVSGVRHDGHTFHVQRDVLGREVRRHAERGRFDIFFGYDAMDRLVEQSVSTATTASSAPTTLARRQWLYDPTGRVLGIQDSRAGTTRYVYDDIGQLVESQHGRRREVFAYDVTGALQGIFDGLGSTPWSIAPGGLLREGADARFEYDENGRRKKKLGWREGRTTDEVTSYFWDCRDRLREVRLPNAERILYTYDAFGRRVRKEIVPPEPTDETPTAAPPRTRVVHFLWDGNVLAEERDSERGKRVFVHEPGTFVPMLQQEQGEVFAYANDHLGTPKELVDANGRVAWAASHSAWGTIAETYIDRETKRTRPVVSPFRLLGQYFDIETGLSHTRFRYFDAEIGGWISADPLGLSGGSGLFGFNGGPLDTVDPFGLCPNSSSESVTAAPAPVFTPKAGLKWGNPASAPTYGHTFKDHTSKLKEFQLQDRARNLKHQVGHWSDDKTAAKFIADVALRGPGVHEVPIPESMGNSYLPTGDKIAVDTGIIVVKRDGSVRTAYPASSKHPRSRPPNEGNE
jgi:RHS repeat-associated protein